MANAWSVAFAGGYDHNFVLFNLGPGAKGAVIAGAVSIT